MEKDKKLYEFNSLEFLNAGVDEIYYRKNIIYPEKIQCF